jgi:hypothetical protein
LFRQNIDRVISRVEERIVWKREVSNLHTHLSTLEYALNETAAMLGKSNGGRFVRTIDSVNAQLIANSVLSSFEKVNELLAVMAQNRIAWQTDANLGILKKCLTLNEVMFGNLSESGILAEEDVRILGARKDGMLASMKREVARA